MNYVRIDLHWHYFIAHAEDEQGKVLVKKKYSNTDKSVQELVEVCGEGCKVVLEATRNWYMSNAAM